MKEIVNYQLRECVAGSFCWRGKQVSFASGPQLDGTWAWEAMPDDPVLRDLINSNLREHEGHLTLYLGYNCTYLVNDPLEGRQE